VYKNIKVADGLSNNKFVDVGILRRELRLIMRNCLFWLRFCIWSLGFRWCLPIWLRKIECWKWASCLFSYSRRFYLFCSEISCDKSRL